MTTLSNRSSSAETSNSVVRQQPEYKDARFWDKLARRYSARPVPNESAYAHKLRLTQRYLSTEHSVLEVGCGTGTTALNHAPHVRQITATDFSASMIEIARERARESKVENASFLVADAHDAFRPGQQFDAVLALNLLHLLPNWKRSIALAHKHVRNGGVFVSSTPCLSEMPVWLKWIAPLGQHLGLMPPLSFFSQEELVATLQLTGFSIEETWQHSTKNGLFIVARKRSRA